MCDAGRAPAGILQSQGIFRGCSISVAAGTGCPLCPAHLTLAEFLLCSGCAEDGEGGGKCARSELCQAEGGSWAGAGCCCRVLGSLALRERFQPLRVRAAPLGASPLILESWSLESVGGESRVSE